MTAFAYQKLSEVLKKNLIFVNGKGGVGKTTISKTIALCHARNGKKVLWVTLEDASYPAGQLKELETGLFHLNCDFTDSFEEYTSMKIGLAPLTKIFLQNKLVRYLSQAAPGIRELVLLGKVWFERTRYDHIVVDMPSTGYGLAMFQSTQNFVKLFKGGPIHRDAEAMMETFSDSTKTGFLVVALPEEMPLREALEHNQILHELFPKNPSAFLVNRKFPQPGSSYSSQQNQLTPPLANSMEDYILKRADLENFNLRLWKDLNLEFGEIQYLEGGPSLPDQISSQFKNRAYL